MSLNKKIIAFLALIVVCVLPTLAHTIASKDCCLEISSIEHCPASIAYVAQNQSGIVAYDGGAQPIYNYDSALIPIANNKENRTAGASSLLAKFAGFLAAGGITPTTKV